MNTHVPGARRNQVNWTLTRQNLLLDWIDTHPEERSALFSQRRQLSNRWDGLSKTTCAMRAATVVFAEDEDPRIRKEALDDPTHFGTVIGDVMRSKSVYSYISCAECRLLSTECSPLGFQTRWVDNYQKINQNIGRAAANMQYSEIEADNALLKKVGESIFDSALIMGR